MNRHWGAWLTLGLRSVTPLARQHLQNYTATMRFVTSFEAECSSQAGVQRLRESQAFVDFMKLFSLPIYFQLRHVPFCKHFAHHHGCVIETSVAQIVRGAFSGSLFFTAWRIMNAAGSKRLPGSSKTAWWTVRRCPRKVHIT
jgi:hypothetical protein